MTPVADPRKVVALEYTPDEGVPRVTVKAIGDMADEVLRMNRSGAGKRVVKDRELVDQLYRLPLNGEIGRELYAVVARLLIHVFEIEGRMMKEKT